MFPEYEHREHPIYAKKHGHQNNYPARFHRHVEIMVPISAPVRLMIQGSSYTLAPGDLYIVFPNLLHSIEARDIEALVLMIDFEKCPAFQELLLHTTPECPVLRKDCYPEEVRHTLERTISLARANIPYQQETLISYANGILGELLGLLRLIPRNMDAPLAQKLQFYLLEHYTQDLTLDSVAQALGYSKFYISRLIPDLFGCNFRTLINSYRIALAQNLLLSDAESIGQIARICGFHSQSAFNRAFLQHTGITPKAHRQQTGLIPEKPNFRNL